MSGMSKHHTNPHLDPTGRFEKHEDFIKAKKRSTSFKAYDKETGLEVIWNEVSISSLSNEQVSFIKERLNVLKKLHHQNMLQIIHWWTEQNDRLLFYITESVSTLSIGERIDKGLISVKPTTVAKWFYAALNALVYLHAQSPPVVHGQMDLYSIFLMPSSGKIKLLPPVVTPFALDGRKNSVSIRYSTPPEMLSGDVTWKSDVWNVGIAFLQAITRVKPYAECTNPAKLIEKLLEYQRPDSIQVISDPLAEDLISKCLQSPEYRPPAHVLLQHPFFTQDFAQMRGKSIENDQIELLIKNKSS